MADAGMKHDYPYLRSARTRFLNFVFKRARPLGVSWKDFYESAAHPKTAKHNEKPPVFRFKELTRRIRCNFSMEQDDRALLIEVTASRAYPQYYIARSTSEAGAIEAVTKHCLLGEFNKARTAVLGVLSLEARIGVCQLYTLPLGGVLAWPDSKIELLGILGIERGK